jgi:hypothetical protein
LLGIVAVLVLVLGGAVLFGPPLAERAPGADATLPALIQETETPAAAEQPRTARIVGLSGGPGWLHERPTFDSPTLPIRLSEGSPVSLLGQQETDSSGVTWALVTAGGYRGWCPVNNLAVGE